MYIYLSIYIYIYVDVYTKSLYVYFCLTHYLAYKPMANTVFRAIAAYLPLCL